MCRKCSGFTCSTYADEEMTLDGDVMEKVAKFLYLGDVHNSGEEVLETVKARIRCGWKKFKDVTNALCKRAAHLRWEEA